MSYWRAMVMPSKRCGKSPQVAPEANAQQWKPRHVSEEKLDLNQMAERVFGDAA